MPGVYQVSLNITAQFDIRAKLDIDHGRVHPYLPLINGRIQASRRIFTFCKITALSYLRPNSWPFREKLHG